MRASRSSSRGYHVVILVQKRRRESRVWARFFQAPHFPPAVAGRLLSSFFLNPRSRGDRLPYGVNLERKARTGRRRGLSCGRFVWMDPRPKTSTTSSTRILGKTMRDAVRNKERWKKHRTPTQDPSGRDGPRPRPSSPRRPRTPRIQPPPRPARIVFCCCVEFHRFSLPSWSQAALKSA